MGGSSGELKGPDLSAGVALDEIADGGLLLGHVGDEAVVVARRGDRCFAVSGGCTHYGGPLGEGIFDGECVRCPWHHARFDVATGDAVAAPALNPVDAWSVQVANGRVSVAGKLSPAVPARIAAPAVVVIVGGGAAGHACAERLRKEGHDGRIVMLSADAAPPVDRPNLSKDYLAGKAPEEWIPLRGPEFFGEQRIELRTGVRAQSIDVAARRVILDGGEAVAWDALVLATGAEAVRLSLPGGEHALTLRTLADSRAIIARAEAGKRAVVIGASFIGLEVAASLRARGVEVDVVAPDAVPLGRVLGPTVGAFVRGLHEANGVRFHLGRKPASLSGDRVTLDDGASLPADLIVSGVGVRPSLQLAAEAGLTVDDGIVVDEFLRTSAPGVWAAGDVARWPDARSQERMRVEHWVVAERMGQTVARNLLGQARRFADVPFFWSQHYDVGINYVGHARRWDRDQLSGSLEKRDALVAYRLDEKIVAVATIGRDAASLEAERAMEQGDAAALEALVGG
jgi:apoptosis-inducing factor 3